jgi:hypothetical protein
MVSLGVAAASTAAARLEAHAQTGAKVPPLRHGINLHHLLNWPEVRPGRGEVTYVWPPFGTRRYQIEPWELQRFRKLGFDFVRLTVDPAIFLASDEERQAELRNLVVDRVRMLNDNELSVIVDLAPISQDPKFAPARIVTRDDPSVFFAYCASAAKLGASLAALPQDRVVFEPLNEPSLLSNELSRWQSMAEMLHAKVRSAAPELALVMTGALWGHFKALLRLDTRPFRGSNLFYTFHYYDPHTFTHQGVASEGARYISGLRWPAVEAQEQAQARAAAAVVADSRLDAQSRQRWQAITHKLIADYYATGTSPEIINADFASVADWAKRNDIPSERILLGEFGMTREGGANRNDRIKWITAVHAAAERHGFPWALWVYRGTGGMALADDSATHALDTDVANSLDLAL